MNGVVFLQDLYDDSWNPIKVYFEAPSEEFELLAKDRDRLKMFRQCVLHDIGLPNYYFVGMAKEEESEQANARFAQKFKEILPRL